MLTKNWRNLKEMSYVFIHLEQFEVLLEINNWTTCEATKSCLTLPIIRYQHSYVLKKFPQVVKITNEMHGCK